MKSGLVLPFSLLSRYLLWGERTWLHTCIVSYEMLQWQRTVLVDAFEYLHRRRSLFRRVYTTLFNICAHSTKMKIKQNRVSGLYIKHHVLSLRVNIRLNVWVAHASLILFILWLPFRGVSVLDHRGLLLIKKVERATVCQIRPSTYGLNAPRSTTLTSNSGSHYWRAFSILVRFLQIQNVSDLKDGIKHKVNKSPIALVWMYLYEYPIKCPLLFFPVHSRSTLPLP